jgi:3-hexulose-6-phosphate synthase
VLLQLAVDDPAHIAVLPRVVEFVDIVEVGTPVLKRFGLGGIATIRELAGGRPVLVDSKTADGGAQEASMYFGLGAIFMTVLAAASGATQEVVNRVAQEHGAYVVADTICSERLPDRRDHYPDRFAYLLLHSPTDVRRAGGGDGGHIARTRAMRKLGYRVAIAGGIDEGNLAEAVAAGPDVVVVGSAITEADNPREVARWISSQLIDRGHGWPPSMRFSGSPSS